jgi:hypothetical protein
MTVLIKGGTVVNADQSLTEEAARWSVPTTGPKVEPADHRNWAPPKRSYSGGGFGAVSVSLSSASNLVTAASDFALSTSKRA